MAAVSVERYSCAGKVFILGEYSVLTGRPALVAAVPPRFSLEVRTPSSLFHGESPVAQLQAWAKKASLPDLPFQFGDPWGGAGGFGFSTAQFAMAYLGLAQSRDSLKRNWSAVWDLY